MTKKKLHSWFKPAHGSAKYTAFIKVAGISISKEIGILFRRAAAGEISHDDLRAEYTNKMGIKRG